MNHLLSSFLLFVLITLFPAKMNLIFSSNNTDYEALVSFKSKITDDPDGILSSWNSSVQFCNWIGITCGKRHMRVTKINLTSKAMVGTLSPSIGNLSFLQVIRLENNAFQGDIPSEITLLFRLKTLVLSNNSFHGKIPSNLSSCTQLSGLFLGGNNLVGRFPTEIGSLPNLKIISIEKNNLHGELPYSIGNLTNLESLSVSTNVFQGSIPDSLGQLSKLTYLGLHANKLSGIIPSSVYNLSLIDTFSLSDNQFNGTLPSKLGLFYPNLIYFAAWDNQFSGPIPPSLSNASQLQTVFLSNNSFSGKITDIFGTSQHLSTLLLGTNNLGNGGHNDLDFLASLVNCTKLKVLGLGANGFGGSLPREVTNLSTRISAFLIGDNQLTGNIPSEIGNLVNLAQLELHKNQFTGTLPTSTGRIQFLRGLVIFSNRLSGKIPAFLGNLSWLSTLYLHDNRLQGSIPSTLGNCENLLQLHLSQNNLNGTIPQEIFNISSLSVALDLSQNQFTGSLPSAVGNLKSLGYMDVSSNKLSGEIPASLGSCIRLEWLSLHDNLFRGSIPSTFSSLRGMQNLDLSQNNLTGLIPLYLGTIPFVYLNLSYNNLEGEVPKQGIFRNWSAVSVAENDRLCGGIPELHMPQCPAKKHKFSALQLSIIITTGCLLFGGTILSFLLFCLLKQKRKKQICETWLKETFAQVSYEVIMRATDGFSGSNLIGVGSFGSVYKGSIDGDGTLAAIKVLNLERRGASRSFIAECEALRNIRHRNLVKIITSCSSIDFQGNDFKALVYEYIPNGSLEKWLHPVPVHEQAHEVENLSLLSRLNIAIDLASAIDYLHNQCHQPIIHCDIKPSNILLDKDMTARVGDFGLARILPELTNPSQSSSIGVKGTIGYAAPEYGVGGQVSKEGDVYSYGILLLEMITGKRPTDNMFENGFNLHKFGRKALDDDNVMEIVDTTIVRDEVMNSASKTEECTKCMVEIGVACSMESATDRMEISLVVQQLLKLRNAFVKSRPSIQSHIR